MIINDMIVYKRDIIGGLEMNNFTFYSPTYFAFGKGTENEAGEYVKRFGGHKVLIHYGGGSVVRSGLLDRVKVSLEKENIPYVLLGGVQPKEFRGLYKHVKISVKTLDIIIVSCIAVIVLLVALDLRNPGFTITFDSRGGSDVAAQNQMYGELLEVPEAPTREGYEFTGWYLDTACQELWDVEEDIIEGDITLYAGWEKE